MQRLICATVFRTLVLFVSAYYGVPSGAQTADRLSDREIVSISEQSYDKRQMMFKRVVLGHHNGVPVIAEFPCSDVCP